MTGPMRVRRQPLDGMRDRVAHLAHLTIAALANHDLEQRLRAPDATASTRSTLHLGRKRAPAFERDAAAQPLEIPLVGHALDQRLVRALQLVARMRHALGELAVVGEDDQALGLEVEPPDRIEVPVDAGLRQRSTTVVRRCGSDRVLTTPRGL